MATTPSAPAVAIFDESGAHEHAICHQRSTTSSTYQTASIAPLGLSLELTRLAIVEDELSITGTRSKQVAIRRKSYISYESVMIREHFVVLERHGSV
jgi:hypothetical protein